MKSNPIEDPLTNAGEAKRFVDNTSGEIISKVFPGFFYVTKNAEQIMTVLGSCIAACIRDPISKVGGINHFMLPTSQENRSGAWVEGKSAENRFGNCAMDNLINALIKHGGVKKRLEVKIFGGGQLLDMSTNIGARNIDFVREYLEAHDLEITASDLGEDYARKVIYDPLTGVTKLKRLREVYRGYVIHQEKELLQNIAKDADIIKDTL